MNVIGAQHDFLRAHHSAPSTQIPQLPSALNLNPGNLRKREAMHPNVNIFKSFTYTL